jgi:hypothetical protein
MRQVKKCLISRPGQPRPTILIGTSSILHELIFEQMTIDPYYIQKVVVLSQKKDDNDQMEESSEEEGQIVD